MSQSNTLHLICILLCVLVALQLVLAHFDLWCQLSDVCMANTTSSDTAALVPTKSIDDLTKGVLLLLICFAELESWFSRPVFSGIYLMTTVARWIFLHGNLLSTTEYPKFGVNLLQLLINVFAAILAVERMISFYAEKLPEKAYKLSAVHKVASCALIALGTTGCVLLTCYQMYLLPAQMAHLLPSVAYTPVAFSALIGGCGILGLAERHAMVHHPDDMISHRYRLKWAYFSTFLLCLLVICIDEINTIVILQTRVSYTTTVADSPLFSFRNQTLLQFVPDHVIATHYVAVIIALISALCALLIGCTPSSKVLTK